MPSAEDRRPARQPVPCKCHISLCGHIHRGCPIISLLTTQASESAAGIALLNTIGWTVVADVRRAKLPFGLVYIMSGRTLEEQATLA